MKWFKHMSNASNDSFVENLEEIYGWEGYGRWFKLLEIIATKMDKSTDCYAEHSWVKWQSLLKGKKNKLNSFLVHCQNEGKIKLEQNGNILKIICPKLLELRDEHTRNSGVTLQSTPELLLPKNQIQESDLNIKDQDPFKKGFDFDVDKFLTDLDRACVKSEAGGYCIDFLISKFNAYVQGKEIPRYPAKAFLAWTISFTKGKSP
jgi:hypothetical protein